MREGKPRNVIGRALGIGVLSSLAGTVTIFGGFFLALRIAERWSGARLSTDTLAAMWNTSHWGAISTVGGFLFSWFAFGFFIAYSRISSRSERN